MDFLLRPDEYDFLAGLRRYLDGQDLSAVQAENAQDEVDIGPHGREFLCALGQAGWLAVGWPKEYGGRGANEVQQWLFREEMDYRRLPTGGVTLSAVGPTLMRLGTPEQKRAYLPPIARGEVMFAVGYTEPGAGTDLADLRTRAVLDGGDYVINGQKLYTSWAHQSTHLWLAVRTGEIADRHHGISVIIARTNTPGITIRPVVTQADERTNEVFFDDVRVPAANIVGTPNGGWGVLMMALDFERAMPHARVRFHLERLIEWWTAREPRLSPEQRAHGRQVLAQLWADLEAGRLLSTRATSAIDEGRVPRAESSMAKVWLTELLQRIASSALDLMGAAGTVAIGEHGAPAGGYFEQRYRASSLLRFAGGTNEIQRDIIAQVGLGLPATRSRVA